MTAAATQRGHYDRKATRAQRAARERDVLLAAGRALLLEQDPDELTVTEVCQRAGVGRNTLYLHFRDVPALLREALQQSERELRERLALKPEQRRTPRAHLAALCEAWLSYTFEAPESAGLLLSSELGRPLAARVLDYELAQLSRQAYAAGLVSRPPNEDTLAAISAAFRALGARAAAGKAQLDQRELGELLTRLVLGVLR